MLTVGARITILRDLFCDESHIVRKGDLGTVLEPTDETFLTIKSLKSGIVFRAREKDVEERSITLEEYLELHKDKALPVKKHATGVYCVLPTDYPGKPFKFTAQGNKITTVD